jgi:hypothetical protein
MRLCTNERIRNTVESIFGKFNNEPDARWFTGQIMDAAFEPYLPVLSVFSTLTGRWFTVRYLPVGYERYAGDREAHKSRVEFYDATYADDNRHGFYRGLGQWTGSYFYVDTLLEGEADNIRVHAGLTLDGGVFAWQIDADAMDVLRAWMRAVDRAPAPTNVLVPGR